MFFIDPLSNPIAVSEIRRQRELYELQKKQKFVEKQQRKKMTQLEEIQSDDRGTYSVHSDEGVGVSAYSADVTTAATWGGSTAQSSNEEDSAVEDDYAATEECVSILNQIAFNTLRKQCFSITITWGSNT